MVDGTRTSTIVLSQKIEVETFQKAKRFGCDTNSTATSSFAVVRDGGAVSACFVGSCVHLARIITDAELLKWYNKESMNLARMKTVCMLRSSIVSSEN